MRPPKRVRKMAREMSREDYSHPRGSEFSELRLKSSKKLIAKAENAVRAGLDRFPIYHYEKPLVTKGTKKGMKTRQMTAPSKTTRPARRKGQRLIATQIDSLDRVKSNLPMSFIYLRDMDMGGFTAARGSERFKRENEESRRFLNRIPVERKYMSFRGRARMRNYLLNAVEYARKIPAKLQTGSSAKIARQKRMQLLTLERNAKPLTTKGNKLKDGLWQRFTNTRLLFSLIARPNFLEGTQITRGPRISQLSDQSNSPVEQKKKVGQYAIKCADESGKYLATGFYDCRIFVHPEQALKGDSLQDLTRDYLEGGQWRYVPFGKQQPRAVLGIQIFDTDPKTLLDFCKVMAVRRPSDPLVVLDAYGNVFYPAK